LFLNNYLYLIINKFDLLSAMAAVEKSAYRVRVNGHSPIADTKRDALHTRPIDEPHKRASIGIKLGRDENPCLVGTRVRQKTS